MWFVVFRLWRNKFDSARIGLCIHFHNSVSNGRKRQTLRGTLLFFSGEHSHADRRQPSVTSVTKSVSIVSAVDDHIGLCFFLLFHEWTSSKVHVDSEALFIWIYILKLEITCKTPRSQVSLVWAVGSTWCNVQLLSSTVWMADCLWSWRGSWKMYECLCSFHERSIFATR